MAYCSDDKDCTKCDIKLSCPLQIRTMDKCDTCDAKKRLELVDELFNKWKMGDIDDNKYYFQMQNVLMFGKILKEEEDAKD